MPFKKIFTRELISVAASPALMQNGLSRMVFKIVCSQCKAGDFCIHFYPID